MNEETLREVADKQAIRDLHSRYCRGLDRMDREMARGVFAEDCSADYHDIYQGSGHGFVDWVFEAHAHMERHSHQISNVLVEVDGERAVSEAYVTVCLWTLPDQDGQQSEIVGRGRYLDRLEKRAGRWLVIAREHVLDMHTVNPLQRDYVSAQSTRDGSDASWRFFERGE